jgi:radical SAM-linked protein
MSRLRIRFTKLGKIRFTSHRDVARMFERAFRRAEVPLAYTEGFSPRPRISFGLALSTGYESLAEYLDADLQDVASTDGMTLAPRLTAALPTGIEVVATRPIDAHAPSLQQDVTSTTWRITVVGADRDSVVSAADDAMGASTIMFTRIRKGQESIDDLRPSLLALSLADAEDDRVTFVAELATQPRALRPAELAGAVWPTVEDVRALRTHQWIERDGARWEPLPSDATDALHAMGRAS